MYRPSFLIRPPLACQVTAGRTLSPDEVRPTGVKGNVSVWVNQIAGGSRLSLASKFDEGSDGVCDCWLHAASTRATAPQKRARTGITHPSPWLGRAFM